MRKIDLKGQKFGRWTVLREGNKQNWVCMCDCGDEKEIFIGSLRSGKSKGCRKCSGERFINDLTGKKYNSLTVISIDKSRTKSRGVMWLCKCDCGNEKIISSNCLVSGSTKSCGECPINFYELKNDFAIIKTFNNKEFKVNLEDFEVVKKYNWYDMKGYACALSNGVTIYMHRVLMDVPKEMEVDHIDSNKSNNLRSNLRVCTHKENSRNTNKQRNNTTSTYKGVSYDKSRKKWEAYIMTNDRKYHLGRYETEKEAALKYNIKAKELFGEYAKINEIRAD